ncbi:flagellar assembly peptidoglycan hydrolase FlgJ [Hydrogenophaga sp. 5NK40-0174]|uniref:flagellar assembly peptidoglycan hydrolase FlgJ n=1 Tax=Hydrogenophaga sp. 5NK40-0174 TaxID=3127649 RepID=UPI003108A8EE
MNATSSMTSVQGLSADPTALNSLHYGASQGGEKGKAALKEAARQFESLFMREIIKSMRQATMKSGLLDSGGQNLGEDLLDQQLAGHLAGMPGGLSSAIERQLSQQMASLSQEARSGLPAQPITSAKEEPSWSGRRSQGTSTVAKASSGGRSANFVDQHARAARQVESETGIPASFMIGQAGHETGWGKSEIRHRDGSNSHNLFGIKATSSWKGDVAEVVTTEYINGKPRKLVAKFRAYDSYADAFRDYAKLIGNSPRYSKVMKELDSVEGFARGLQQAGYATDPNYASKLGRAINMALSLQRAQDS